MLATFSATVEVVEAYCKIYQLERVHEIVN